ncbi:porin [Burkholderia sp. Bp9140]|uniref:porin n=1 Tax=Burkholderia sp. Bp9140 TaxID=2184572 RepID=UPI000F55EBD8|nr:porin [Burkholderia sp. Bp9140]RQR51592.1 porin [Burkholderia sp. Bp9140]
MKKTCIAASVFLVFSVPALAQSTVTLYGLIDEGIDFTNNAKGHKAYQMESGYLAGSRWGMKGTEDLGGGYKAVFQIESGFDVNTGKLGQGGLGMGRQAYVGIDNERYGRVTLGRQYDSLVDYLAQTTVTGGWGGYIFAHPYDNDNATNTFRVNNTVKYASPTIAGGLNFGGTYSFSNDTNFANNRQYSVGAQYATGGLLLAAAYLQANNPSATASGAINNGGDENFVAQRLRIFGAGVNYTIGAATLGFVYTNTYVSQPLSSGYVGAITPTAGTLSSLRFQNFEVNGKYQFTPAFSLGAVYTYTHTNFNTTAGNAHPNYHQAGLMANYQLSKRTNVYLQGAYQHVSGDKTGSVLDVAYVPGAADVSSSRNQVVVRAAIMHKF